MSILHVDENKHKAGFFEGLLSSCEGYVKRHGNSEGRIQDNNHTRKRLGVAVKHVPVPDADIRISRAINMLMEAVSQKNEDLHRAGRSKTVRKSNNQSA